MPLAKNWWFDGSVNYLKGIVGEPTNPAILSDEYIVTFLHKIPAAREDFAEAYRVLSLEEKARLDALLEENPFAQRLRPNFKEYEDERQRWFNRQGVYTKGKFGLRLLRY